MLPDSPVKDHIEDSVEYPHVGSDLLLYLNDHFPNKLPDIAVSDRELGRLIGVRHIIDHLADLAQRQKEESSLSHVLRNSQAPNR